MIEFVFKHVSDDARYIAMVVENDYLTFSRIIESHHKQIIQHRIFLSSNLDTDQDDGLHGIRLGYAVWLRKPDDFRGCSAWSDGTISQS